METLRDRRVRGDATLRALDMFREMLGDSAFGAKVEKYIVGRELVDLWLQDTMSRVDSKIRAITEGAL